MAIDRLPNSHVGVIIFITGECCKLKFWNSLFSVCANERISATTAKEWRRRAWLQMVALWVSTVRKRHSFPPLVPFLISHAFPASRGPAETKSPLKKLVFTDYNWITWMFSFICIFIRLSPNMRLDIFNIQGLNSRIKITEDAINTNSFIPFTSPHQLIIESNLTVNPPTS